MEFFEAITQRHSYRGGYTADPVSNENIRRIISAGLAAPSGCNKQTVHICAVTKRDLLFQIWQSIGKMNEKWWNGTDGVHSAPCAIVVFTDKAIAYGNETFYKQDYSAAIENMLLSIAALGYASCWIEGEITSQPACQDKLRDLLNPDSALTAVCVLPVGVPASEVKPTGKKPFDERAKLFE
jgi:nitroreductase